jgi:hypothetical protein
MSLKKKYIMNKANVKFFFYFFCKKRLDTTDKWS